MKRIVHAKTMQDIECYTIETLQIPSLVLMERAALAVAKQVRNILKKDEVVQIVCGTGNNGADGLALARILMEEGIEVSVKILSDPFKGSKEFQMQYQILQNAGFLWEQEEKNYAVIVDAIFGVGLNRDIEGVYAEEIQNINKQKAYVIAVDVPSGINDRGQICGIAIKADCTITFGNRKTGLCLYPGRAYAGECIEAAIGFLPQSYSKIKQNIWQIEEEDKKRIPKRNPDSHKGTYGRILIVAGSKNMSGAAYFSAKAAYRMGGGLVRILTIEENRTILQTALPEAVLSTYQKAEDIVIQESIDWATQIVIGPGLGQGKVQTTILQKVLQADVPTVVDADALTMISEKKELEKFYHKQVIITPHMGEMSRLTKKSISEIKENILEECQNYAKEHGLVCVLKDAATVISDGKESFINSSGNSGMATAGSGDVLTGIIAALLSVLPILQAAAFGVYLHGCAGDKARLQKGEWALIASDMLEALSGITEIEKRV